MGSSEQGGHRHGYEYNLPEACKTTIKVPKSLVEDCKKACFDIFTAYLVDRYGAASLEQLSPGDYYEALQVLGTLPKKKHK